MGPEAALAACDAAMSWLAAEDMALDAAALAEALLAASAGPWLAADAAGALLAPAGAAGAGKGTGECDNVDK